MAYVDQMNISGADQDIRDRELTQATSQSTIANADVVLLKDTSGHYHEIAKSSFMEAVRGALGSIIKTLDKGTAINGIAVTGSTGTVNDLGFSSPADLASVLGVAQYHTNLNSGDLNQLTEPGTWLLSFGPNVINGPVDVNNGQAILEIIRLGTSSPHFLQRVTMETNGKVYTRCKKATAEDFYPWSE